MQTRIREEKVDPTMASARLLVACCTLLVLSVVLPHAEGLNSLVSHILNCCFTFLTSVSCM